MRSLFLPDIAGVSGIGMVERFPINALRVLGQMSPHGIWQIGIQCVGHGCLSPDRARLYLTQINSEAIAWNPPTLRLTPPRTVAVATASRPLRTANSEADN